jgi:uncharacterized RDD family membrane protein YckC
MKRLVLVIIFGLVFITAGLWGVIGSIIDVVSNPFRPLDHVGGILGLSACAFLGIYLIIAELKRRKVSVK